MPVRHVLRAGVAYFGVVFAVGFVLGTVRTLWLAPALGERRAELLEMPFMLAACALAARWVVRRFALPVAVRPRLAVGGLALVLLVVAELGVVLFVRGEPPGDYLARRDPVSGVVYLASLLLFALFPWWAGAGGASERRRAE